MPRKTSQRSAAIAEGKNEGNAPRRSGRAVVKQETSSKEASRSRRSSTAAQTAASVADSRTPKGKGSRRGSTSPSEGRSKETPATRVKSTRRSTSRVNYKESDGEEEVPATKYDENFESGEELEESDSDEKLKTRGKSRVAKTPAKGRETKSKGGSRSRRGRPIKKKDDEESETFDVSDDSVEAEDTPEKKQAPVKEKETAKPARSRRQRSEIIEVESKPASEEKSRPSRRSGRAAANKVESPQKRPSRSSVQAKRYAEEEDDDIEEISDTKAMEEDTSEKKGNESRKRKRAASPEETNKRLKDEDNENSEESVKEVDEKDEKKDSLEEKIPDEKSVEEPMDVDESSVTEIAELKSKNDEAKEEKMDSKIDEVVDTVETVKDKMEEDNLSSKEETDSNKKDSVKSHEKTPETETKKAEPVSLELDSSQSVKEACKDTADDNKTVDEAKMKEPKVESVSKEVLPQPSEDPQAGDSKSDSDKKSESLPSPQPPAVSETKSEKTVEKVDSPQVTPTKKEETIKNDSYSSEEKKVPPVEETSTPPTTPVPSTITPPKESKIEAALNGSEQSVTVQNSVNEIHSSNTTTTPNFDRTENTAPKANGAHNDVEHTNSSPKDQYYLLPGRKYVSNSKLNENLRQSIKNHTFGFVSFNLGTPNSDAYLQKEKLLNELNSLNAHVICLQQVAKPFYDAILEPSLDALGFKSVFSQPQDSLKGMATFYKSSYFRLSGKSDISLKVLIEKGIEASTLVPADKTAVKSHIRRCGSVLFTHLSTVIGTQTVTVANVQIPRTDFSSHALQVSCLAKEVVRINGGTNKPLLLAGEFNIAENDASYQLLRDGYLSNEMIEELQRRKDVVLPEKENASLVNLLWNCFQHPSSILCSCYHSVLDHEIFIPELKASSPDLLWYSSGSLHTVGVLDAVSDKPGDHHLSLKADVAFSV